MKQEQRVWHRYIYTHKGITYHLWKKGIENVDIKTPCISPDNYIPVSTIKKKNCILSNQMCQNHFLRISQLKDLVLNPGYVQVSYTY